MRIAFRCCCVPQKILGHIDVDSNLVREGNVLHWYLTQDFSEHGNANETAEILRLPIARYYETTGRNKNSLTGFDYHSGLAIKSEGVNVETLRRISGFQEYHPEIIFEVKRKR